jgi:hypothetical protein
MNTDSVAAGTMLMADLMVVGAGFISAEAGPDDHLPAIMATASTATVNTVILYVLGVAYGWR